MLQTDWHTQGIKMYRKELTLCSASESSRNSPTAEKVLVGVLLCTVYAPIPGNQMIHNHHFQEYAESDIPSDIVT